MSIKILLADDHRVMLDGLSALLQDQKDMEIVGTAGDGLTASQMVGKLNPDVVLMDISMPKLNGIEATRRIIAENAEVKIIILSMHSKKRLVSEALKAGASGYILKNAMFEEVCNAIRTVVANQIYLGPEIADIVVKNYVLRQSNDPSDVASAFSLLTARERQVLQLLTEGETTQQIAASLYVSVSAVDKHRRNIMNKLNIGSIAELTKYAIREGITSLEA